MNWFAPNDYLVQAKWFGVRQKLFGASQMIWRARINYYQLKYDFWRCPLESSVDTFISEIMCAIKVNNTFTGWLKHLVE